MKGSELPLFEKKSETCSQKKHLLAVYILNLKHNEVTITDVAREVGVSKSSATSMITKLCEKELLHRKVYGNITVLERGRIVAEELYGQVKNLYNFFTGELSMNRVQAQKDAVALVSYCSDIAVDGISDILGKNAKIQNSQNEILC